MSELSPTAAHPTGSSPTSSRGTVTVEDYSGVPAAQAARSVRRLGLRPGLDRQFGGEAETFGLVVAQQPDPGDDAPRGSLVTLYVSAPSAGGRDPEPESPSSPASHTEPSPAASDPVAGSAASSRPVRRKRRGHSRAAAPPEQAPTPPDAEQRTPELLISEPVEFSEPALPEPADEAQAPVWDELTASMRDVFTAGGAPMRGRGLYPRKPMALRLGGWLAWLRAHKAIVVAACLALGLWVASGSMRTRAARPAARTPPRMRGPARRSGGRTAHARARSHPTRTARPGKRTGEPVHGRRQARGTALLVPASASAKARSRATSQQIASAPEAVARQTETQTGGGPFSP